MEKNEKLIQQAMETVVRIERKYYFDRIGSKTKRRKELKEQIDILGDQFESDNGGRDDY